MPQSLNAVFSADFSQLEKGAAAADIHIQIIEKASQRAAAEIGKMAGSFRGDALIRDATLGAKAIEAIGGATKLTIEDQKRFAAQANAATDALKRMGHEVPPSLQKISAEINTIVKAHEAAEAAAKAQADAEKKAADEVRKAAEAAAKEQADAAKKAAADALRVQEQFGQNLRTVGQGLTTAGTALTATISAPIIAGFALSVKAAKDFESAYANVVKTVDGFDVDAFGNLNADAKAFSLQIRELAKEIPVTASELANIAAIGGQFGISRSGLLEFTETVAKLGVAIDGISAEEAAASIAQISKIVGVAESDIDNLSSALVDLGNNGTSTEATILEMSKRFASAGATAGLTGAEVLGVSAALANLGVEAEAGGTALSKTFGEIGAAVDRGGEDLAKFAKAAGMSADAFAKVWKQSAVQGFDVFLKGLKDAQAAGGNLTVILEDLGIKEARQASAIRALALDYDNFKKTVDQSTDAFQKNTALSEEARKKYATFDNQLQSFQNKLNDIGIELGGPILQGLNSLIDAADPVIDVIADLAKEFAELPQSTQLAVGAIVGAAGLGPIFLIFAGQVLEATASILEFKKAVRGIAATNAAADIAAVAGATGNLGANASRVLPLLGKGGLVGGIVAVGGASAIAASQVESNWSKALTGSLNPLNGLIISLRDARAEWTKWTEAAAKGDKSFAAQTFADLQRGAVESGKALDDLGTVISHVGDRALDAALAFGQDWLTQTENVAAAVVDYLTPGLKEAVEWMGKVAEAAPGFRDLHRGAKLVADVVGFDLKTSLADAAMVASGSLIPGLAGVSSKVPSVETWQKWGEKLAVAADIVRELEAMMERMSKIPPPKMFQGDTSFRDAFEGDFARMLEDTTAEIAIRTQGKIAQALSESARLAKQYADDMQRVGKGVFEQAAKDKTLYNLSVKEAAALHEIAETSLARYISEMKSGTRAVKDYQSELKKTAAFQDLMTRSVDATTKELREMDAKRLKEAMAGAERSADAIVKTLNEKTRAEQNAARIIRELTMSELEFKMDAIIREGDARKEMIESTGELARQAHDAIDREVATSLQALVMKMDEFRQTMFVLGATMPMIYGPLGAAFGELPKDIESAKTKTIDLGDSIDGLARAWSQLAQIRPLEGWIQDVAELIQLMNIGSQVGKQFSQAFAKRDENGKIITGAGAGFDFSALGGSEGAGNAIAAYANLAQIGIQGYGALDQATDVMGRGNRALRGAATGASIGGAIVPGWGHLVGAIVGALVGALRNPGFEDVFKRVAHNFGVNITEELARAIDKSKKAFGDSRQASEIFHLDKIIQQAGGVKDRNVKQLSQALRDSFSMLETGKFTVEDVTDTLDKNIAAFAAHIQKSKSLATTAFQDLFELNQRFGTNSQELRAFLESQTGVLGGGVATLSAPLLEQSAKLKDQIDKALKDQQGAGERNDHSGYEEASKRIADLLAQQKQLAAESGAEFERLGVIAVASFNAATRGGLDMLSAVQQLGPGLDALLLIQKNLGIETENAGIKELATFRDLVNQNQALVASTSALGETIRALASIGGLTTDALAAMEGQGLQTFERLKAAGFTENQSLAMMKDFILNIIEAHDQLGTPIDENTQKLIDQAQAAGLLKDKQASATDIMKQGFDKVTQAVLLVAEALGAKVPTAAEQAKKAIDTIPKKVPVDVQFSYTELNSPDFQGGRIVRPPADLDPYPEGTSRAHTERPEFATGGWGNFGSGTLAMLHGKEAIFTEPQLRGLAGVVQRQNERIAEETSIHIEFGENAIVVHGNADAGLADRLADQIAMKIMQGGRTRTLWREAVR